MKTTTFLVSFLSRSVHRINSIQPNWQLKFQKQNENGHQQQQQEQQQERNKIKSVFPHEINTKQREEKLKRRMERKS
jgi:hypothetical protein